MATLLAGPHTKHYPQDYPPARAEASANARQALKREPACPGEQHGLVCAQQQNAGLQRYPPGSSASQCAQAPSQPRIASALSPFAVQATTATSPVATPAAGPSAGVSQRALAASSEGSSGAAHVAGTANPGPTAQKAFQQAHTQHNKQRQQPAHPLVKVRGVALVGFGAPKKQRRCQRGFALPACFVTHCAHSKCKVRCCSVSAVAVAQYVLSCSLVPERRPRAVTWLAL